MRREEAVTLLRGGREGIGEWNRTRAAGEALLDLEGVDLSRAAMDDADLRRVSLRGADLRGASLRGADLSEADLTGALLSRASLNGAKLGKADLRRAELVRANLRDADLTGAALEGARIVGAEFVDAILGEAEGDRIPAGVVAELAEAVRDWVDREEGARLLEACAAECELVFRIKRIPSDEDRVEVLNRVVEEVVRALKADPEPAADELHRDIRRLANRFGMRVYRRRGREARLRRSEEEPAASTRPGEEDAREAIEAVVDCVRASAARLPDDLRQEVERYLDGAVDRLERSARDRLRDAIERECETRMSSVTEQALGVYRRLLELVGRSRQRGSREYVRLLAELAAYLEARRGGRGPTRD